MRPGVVANVELRHRLEVQELALGVELQAAGWKALVGAQPQPGTARMIESEEKDEVRS